MWCRRLNGASGKNGCYRSYETGDSAESYVYKERRLKVLQLIAIYRYNVMVVILPGINGFLMAFWLTELVNSGMILRHSTSKALGCGRGTVYGLNRNHCNSLYLIYRRVDRTSRSYHRRHVVYPARPERNHRRIRTPSAASAEPFSECSDHPHDYDLFYVDCDQYR